jgi:hypothetical protein
MDTVQLLCLQLPGFQAVECVAPQHDRATGVTAYSMHGHMALALMLWLLHNTLNATGVVGDVTATAKCW